MSFTAELLAVGVPRTLHHTAPAVTRLHFPSHKVVRFFHTDERNRYAMRELLTAVVYAGIGAKTAVIILLGGHP
jgi:hypothetical protein